MEIVLCHCDWDIPDVEALPAHMHYTKQRVQCAVTGRIIETQHWVPQHGWTMLSEYDGVHFPIRWKMVARTYIELMKGQLVD